MMTTLPFVFSTVPSQNTFIFEPDAGIRQCPRSQLAAGYLADLLRYCLYGSGEAVVMKIKYHRMGSKNTFHKFLLCYVHDKCQTHGWEAVIRIECSSVVDAPQKSQGEGSSPSLSSKSSTSLSSNSSKPSGCLYGIADNTFTITSSPDAEAIKSWLLSTLHFIDSNLVVKELAVATKVTTEAETHYHFITNQCLWFTLLIWNIISNVKSGAFHETAVDKDSMGTFSGLLLLHDNASSVFGFRAPDKLAKFIGTYHMQWNQWLLDIEGRKLEMETPARELLEVQRENQQQREEIEHLKIELQHDLYLYSGRLFTSLMSFKSTRPFRCMSRADMALYNTWNISMTYTEAKFYHSVAGSAQAAGRNSHPCRAHFKCPAKLLEVNSIANRTLTASMKQFKRTTMIVAAVCLMMMKPRMVKAAAVLAFQIELRKEQYY
ncbi:hypothetical protein F5146DRAFT_1004015 [Armillaria mellea]|nr:hypothetical protein F5146DRAFT_1004015 [Armillaria mellea]